MLGILKSILGAGGSKNREKEISFDIVPDGKYLVKYADEKANVGKLILIIFEITKGDHKGTFLPMPFTGNEAKLVSK